MKQVFCFCCGNLRSSEGAVQRSWGLGVRWFCKKHAELAKTAPTELANDAADEPKRAQVAAKPLAIGKARRGSISLAAWCREAAKSMSFDEVVAGLIREFPESKPGLNPKLAKGYVTCYLKRGAAK